MKTSPVIALLILSSSLAFTQVKITTNSVPAGTVSVPYTATIATKNGAVPFVWSAQGMPSGLTLTPSADTRSATLTGMPTTTASYSFNISVEGHGGHVSTVAYTLTIQQAAGHVADLNWQAGAGQIVGYNLYRSTTQGGPYSQVNGSLLAGNNFSDSDVTNGTSYYYVATEVDSQGQESGYSSEVVAQIPTGN